MNQRAVWVAAGSAALVAVLLTVTYTLAQRPDRPAGGVVVPYPGRFTVAHATATQVLVLDTATGSVYSVAAIDFRKPAEMGRTLDTPLRPVDAPRIIDRELKDRPLRDLDRDKDITRPREKDVSVRDRTDKTLRDGREKDTTIRDKDRPPLDRTDR